MTESIDAVRMSSPDTSKRLLGRLLRVRELVLILALLVICAAVLVYAGGRQISATVLPDTYEGIARIHILGVPLLVWLALLITLVIGLAARFTRAGRNLYALGSNPEGARILGISEARGVAFV